jgi:hypothetical protein
MQVKLSSLGIKTLSECFASARSWFVMIIFASGIFILSVLLQNWQLVREVFFRVDALFYHVYPILWLQIWHAQETMGAFGFWILWLLTALFGANIALVLHLRRISKKEKVSASKGILGMVIGVLGVGCLACNASILGTILASLGGVGLITLLPFEGKEFLLLGLLLGLYSLVSLARASERKTCPIPTVIGKA